VASRARICPTNGGTRTGSGSTRVDTPRRRISVRKRRPRELRFAAITADFGKRAHRSPVTCPEARRRNRCYVRARSWSARSSRSGAPSGGGVSAKHGHRRGVGLADVAPSPQGRRRPTATNGGMNSVGCSGRASAPPPGRVIDLVTAAGLVRETPERLQYHVHAPRRRRTRRLWSCRFCRGCARHRDPTNRCRMGMTRWVTRSARRAIHPLTSSV
jgi:hypothetical protein